MTQQCVRKPKEAFFLGPFSFVSLFMSATFSTSASFPGLLVLHVGRGRPWTRATMSQLYNTRAEAFPSVYEKVMATAVEALKRIWNTK